MRKFKTKKIAAVIVAASMAFSVSACGAKEEQTTAAATEATETTASVASTEQDASTEATTENAATNENEITENLGKTVDPDTPYFAQGEDDGSGVVQNGDVIIDVNFDDNDTDGFHSYTNGGQYKLNVEDGALVMDIERVGGVDYGCQTYYDGFALSNGCVYTYSFDMWSDIDRSIQYRLQINGGDYHAYMGDDIKIGKEKTSYSFDFTMEEDSDPAPRLCFNCGKFADMSDDPGAHKIYIDNIKLTVKDAGNAEAIQTVAPSPIIAVSQIGYNPQDTKITTLMTENAETVMLVDATNNQVVYETKLGKEKNDIGVRAKIKQGDFTDYKQPGVYFLYSVVDGSPYRSYEFEIGENLYDDLFKDAVLMLYNQRCGVKLEESISGDFAHEACHTGEAIVYGTDVKKDVNGGWHDAGDYGRYVVPGATTVQDLFNAYKYYNVTADDIGIPESGNNIPDVLDEAKFELDWMMKMQDETSGGVYHKVTGLVFPETVVAVEETQQMYLSAISTAATADFAAVMAEASVLYKDYDAEYAAKCLEVAKKAWTYVEGVGRDYNGFKNTKEIVTGEYPDYNTMDETYWAGIELFLATGDETYKKAFTDIYFDNMKVALGWADIAGYASYDLLSYSTKEQAGEIYDRVKTAFIENADSLLKKIEYDGYHMAQGGTYSWGSNQTVADTGSLLVMAAKISGDNKYLTAAKQQLDYLLGCNSVGYCFVTGYGSVSPDHTHHRPSQALGKTMKGMLVGGPNSNLEDPYAKEVLREAAPAMCYADNEQTYSCNEVTIYWNSALIALLAALK